MIPPWDARGCFGSYADPDAPVDVAPEMMISAYPYGPANIPIQDEVKELIAARNDKGMKIFGFTSLDQVPHWMGMDEPRVLVPWPTKDGSLAAGMAASAGATDREHRKATEAMSAMARAMQRKGQAALVRAVWTQNSDKVSFGALTPHITKEGDFLLFVPLPFAEDMYSNDFKPLPVPGCKAAAQLGANAKAKLVPTDEQRAAAAALVDSLDGSGPRSVGLPQPVPDPNARAHRGSSDERTRRAASVRLGVRTRRRRRAPRVAVHRSPRDGLPAGRSPPGRGRGRRRRRFGWRAAG